MFAELLNSSSPLHEKTFDEYLAAGRAETPRAMIRMLSFSPQEHIRERVAENSFAPQSVLEALSKDPSAQVRAAVAHNPKTSWIVLAALAKDQDPDVRFSMAENPHLPLHVLNMLAADENPYVSHRARHTLADLNADKQQRMKASLANQVEPCSGGLQPALSDDGSGGREPADLDLEQPCA